MHVRALVLAVVTWMSVTAEAREPRGQAKSPDPDMPAVEPAADEDLWTWIARLDGEVPTEEAREAMEQRSEEEISELGLIDQLANVSVPTEFYKDPSAALKPDPLFLDKIDASEFDIPVVVNDDVVKWMKYFTGSGRKYYERYLMRSTKYRPMMYREIEARKMPRDLVYLSMIESGYNAHAYSSAAAAGLWQFIEGTARLYDLRVDWWIDERRDPQKSTAAGLAFLADLYKMHGDWYLAFASYNTGPGRVKRAVEKAGSKDFYELTRQNLLHPETANYVPKLVAAAIIGKHPERYGFTKIDYQPELTVDTAPVDGSVDLEVLARCAGMSLEEFQELNPALRRYSTPTEGFAVHLPVGTHDAFLAKLAEIPPAERVALVEHRVKRGETLSAIARKYGVTTSDVVKVNRLASANKVFVGMKLVVPTKGRVAEAIAQADSAPSKATEKTSNSDEKVADASTGRRATDADLSPPKPAPKAKYHTVRSGDTLSGIADRYHASITQVKSWNGLRSNKIFSGQKLKVSNPPRPADESRTADAKRSSKGSEVRVTEKGGETSVSKSTSESSKSTSDDLKSAPSGETADDRLKGAPPKSSLQKVRYKVRKGDALSAIAARHKVTVAQIQKWSKLGKKSSIQAGQVLTIYVDAPRWSQYTVKAGDSLTEIAVKLGCTVADLKSWNNFDDSVIHPGQVLKVKK